MCGLNKQNKGRRVFILSSVRWILSWLNKSSQFCRSGAFFLLSFFPSSFLSFFPSFFAVWQNNNHAFRSFNTAKVKSRTFLSRIHGTKVMGKVVSSKCIPEQPAAQWRNTFYILSVRRRQRNAHNVFDERLLDRPCSRNIKLQRESCSECGAAQKLKNDVKLVEGQEGK